MQRSRAHSNFLLFPLVSSDAVNGFTCCHFMLATRFSELHKNALLPVVLEETDGCTQAAAQQ